MIYCLLRHEGIIFQKTSANAQYIKKIKNNLSMISTEHLKFELDF